jgi:para-nitrobenzyl esterase
MYRFDWASPLFGGLLGACHGLDIPFVFGTHRSPASLLTGADAPDDLSAQMRSAWIAFAATGDPNNESIPRVEPYELKRRQTLIFDTPASIVEDPDSDRRRLWDGVI